MERKYVIDLIPVKNYEKGFVFLKATTLKDITNHSLKLPKVFSQSHLKPIPHFMLLFPSIWSQPGLRKICLSLKR